MNTILKIKNFLGRVYRSAWGIYHNKFDIVVEPKKDIEFRVLGRTVEQRNIMCYEMGMGKKAVVFVGGIHGNEVGTVKLGYRILDWCYWNKKLFENSLRLYVIPVLNVDGYEQAKKNPNYMGNGWVGRLNANGVDLNRNFPTKNFRQHCYWLRGKGYKEREEVYCGSHAGSEPETQALVDFVLKNEIKLIVSLHNLAGEVFIKSEDLLTKSLADKYQDRAKFKVRFDMKYPADLSEWAEESNIHWMVVEGSNRWGSDWRRQGKAVEAVVRELAEKEFREPVIEY